MTATTTRPDDRDYDEATTRDLFIDLLPGKAGWSLDQARDREFPVVGMLNVQGTGFVVPPPKRIALTLHS